jgi:SagB-type dehydrogenase family enzyme
MRKIILLNSAMLLLFGSCAMPSGLGNNAIQSQAGSADKLELPKPVRQGRMSLEEAITRRRSVREFKEEALTAKELSQLLWAAQGITHREGLRTAPSAGALYPLELYVATSDGFFRYEPRSHRLKRRAELDLRPAICRAALEQDAIREAPAVFVITAIYERTAQKYGEARTPRYVHMEVGHAAQNLLLEAVALGMGGVPVGAFYDAEVQNALSLPREERPLYLIPVGHPR